MTDGTFLNLFEISFPTRKFLIHAKEWSDHDLPLNNLKRELYPSRLFACDETNRLYLFGREIETTSTEHGFLPVEMDVASSPKLTGRLISFALRNYFVGLGFEPQYRDYLSDPRNVELTDMRKPFQRIESRIDVFLSYRIQSVFLRLAGGLRFFVLVKPRLRYRFSHTLEQIHSSVDCSGKYIRISCPDECIHSECPVYNLKGRIAGRFEKLVSESEFVCRHFNDLGTVSYVKLGVDSRTVLMLPSRICEIEASIANISMIFTERFDKARASKVISDLRVASGDLLHGNPRTFVNPEVGKRHWGDIAQFVGLLETEVELAEILRFSVEKSPVKAIEGGYIPDSMYYDDTEDEDDEEDESASDIF